MLSVLAYLFTEKDMRLLLKGLTIKQVPIKQDSEPIIKFTDNYQITIKHVPRIHYRFIRRTSQFQFLTRITVLQKQLHDFNVTIGKYKYKKKKKRKGGG